MSTCDHDSRFHIMFAKNGCLACHCEAQAEDIKRLKHELELKQAYHTDTVQYYKLLREREGGDDDEAYG